MREVIRTERLSFWYGSKKVLHDVELSIMENSITAILGHSGSGKSTLLKVFNRMTDLIPGARMSGKVEVFGKDVREWDPYELRRRMGMLFQIPNPFPHLSIYDNVAIAAQVSRNIKDKKEIQATVEWALRAAALWDDVEDRLDDFPYKLSGGQQQRLCLARALAMKPEILLLDEPTANIDFENTIIIENALKDIAKSSGITIVIVTHLPDQAVRVSDHMIIMNRGVVVEKGKTEEIVKNPREKFTKLLFNGFFREKI
ncbi:MAG: phosphate ABC transporter ATP-binding protein [Fervidicoccaceae archaeon]